MRFRLHEHGVQAVLLDIEGTTTPIAFVYDVLFPFARAHLHEYLRTHKHDPVVRDTLALLRQEWRRDAARHERPEWPDAGPASASAYVEWLMDHDRKSTGLKALQGLIWQGGYRDGRLKGEVYPDVPPAFERWRGSGAEIAIYSSGSVVAQRLLFGSTTSGDLTGFLAAFFDTAVGPKTAVESYRDIARALSRAPSAVLFVSDVPGELQAATSAGCQVLLAARPGNRGAGEWDDALTIHSFDEIV